MIDVLLDIEKQLPSLLRDGEPWNDLYIDYERPIVLRMWRQVGDYRVYLHQILPTSPTCSIPPLWHPHPWPSAIRILNGHYEMSVGTDPGDYIESAKLILGPGTLYEMTDERGWHSVNPLGNESVMSVMITGRPWKTTLPVRSYPPMRGLTTGEREELVFFMMGHYSDLTENYKDSWKY